jgi:hypothetical protein
MEICFVPDVLQTERRRQLVQKNSQFNRKRPFKIKVKIIKETQNKFHLISSFIHRRRVYGS